MNRGKCCGWKLSRVNSSPTGKKELSRHGHRLRINTLLSVRSISRAKNHDSVRSVIFLRTPFFPPPVFSSFVCTIWWKLLLRDLWWLGLEPGLCTGRPRGKGSRGGDAKGSPSHQAGGSPRCRPTRSLMSPKLNQLPPLSHLTASLVGSHCTQIHPFDIFISTFGGFPLGITGRVGCAGATGLRSVASRPGGGLPAVGQQRTSTGAPLTARTPATARDNCHHNKGTPHWRDDHPWGSHFYTSSLQETYEMQECNWWEYCVQI